jgi:hypothetical protein
VGKFRWVMDIVSCAETVIHGVGYWDMLEILTMGFKSHDTGRLEKVDMRGTPSQLGRELIENLGCGQPLKFDQSMETRISVLWPE